MEKFDYYKVLSGLDGLADWDYTESEGDDCTRFDKGQQSLWVYRNGSIDGHTNNNKVKEYLRANGVMI